MQSRDCRPSPASVVSPSPLVESPCPSLATHHACLRLLTTAGGDGMPSMCVCVGGGGGGGGGENKAITSIHVYVYMHWYTSSPSPVQF